MTTHTLADGTGVPEHYDFNQHFDPLQTHNQGQDPTCYLYEHASLCEAALRIWQDKNIDLHPKRIVQEQDGGTRKVWTFTDHLGVEVVTDYSGENIWDDPAFAGLSKKEAIIKGLWLNGVLEGGVTMQHSYERMWSRPDKYAGYDVAYGGFHHLPTLEMLPGDLRAIKDNTWAHAQPLLGYDWTNGVIPQNSWGLHWAMRGRCYISWDAVERGGVDGVYALTFWDHPLNSLVMPPERAA